MTGDHAVDPVDVPTRGGTIRLGQFLKLADLVDQGSDAKALVSTAGVLVNGAVETRRGRQLVTGDVVTVGGRSARVAERPRQVPGQSVGPVRRPAR